LQSRERQVKVKDSEEEKSVKTRAHVFVSGRVQGVFFRTEIRHEAKKRDVKGWVCNLPDERVEAVFEGEETKVRELVEFCRRGPPGARVTNIDVSWKSYRGEFNSFEIRYV
jgi:acylphosphatase